MFEDKIHNTIEVYVDNMLVKSEIATDHVEDLLGIFQTMRKYKIRVNPAKCTFWITSGKFLRYIVTNRGIEADPDKVLAILEMRSPVIVKDVQKLNGCLASLGSIISRSSDKYKYFFGTLRKWEQWSEECEDAFQKIKQHLTSLPLLQIPEPEEILTLYLGATTCAISAVLVKNMVNEEKSIYFISKSMSPAEKNYKKVE